MCWEAEVSGVETEDGRVILHVTDVNYDSDPGCDPGCDYGEDFYRWDT